MRLMAQPLREALRGCPEADDQGMLFEAFEICGIGDATATGVYDVLFPACHFGDVLSFHFAKCSLAPLSKNLGNTHPRALLDEMVGVDQLEPQGGGEQSTD